MMRARTLVNAQAQLACALAAALLCVTLLACEEAPVDPIRPIEGFGDADAGTGTVLAYAVMSTDRTVTSIGLLQPNGTPLRAELVHSGSARADLATALSGDVALPTDSGDPRVLTLLDRYLTDVITRIDVASGRVLGQLRTHDPDPGAAAWSSNPHDFVQLEPDLAWVSRFNPNPSVADDDPNAGNDLIAIDPTALVRRDERIALHALDTMVEWKNPDSGTNERLRAYARPARIVRVGRFLVVGLARDDVAYIDEVFGPGAVALIDLDAQHASAHELPGVANCTEVVPVVDDDASVLVACTGPLKHGVHREHAGLARLSLRDGALHTDFLWRASEHPDAALAVHWPVSIGDGRAVAVAAGQSELAAGRQERDQLYVIDLTDGAQTPILQAEGSWVLGQGRYDAGTRTLLVPDASVDRDQRPTAGVHRFEIEPGALPRHRDVVDMHDTLPPWQLAPL
jgi:hypothetical protein